jgi:hypothetical protein
MVLDLVSGAASTAPKAGDAPLSLHVKRKRRNCEDDDAVALVPGLNPQCADSTTLQPHDNNIQLREELTEPKATVPSLRKSSHLLRKFEYSESEISILEVIGSGDHAVVYRIAAGGRTFALKVVSTCGLYKIEPYV